MFLAFSLSLAASAQLRISGLVEHEGHPLSDVTVKIMVDGAVVQTVEATKRGKYEVELDVDRSYTMVFTRPFMFPVSLDIDATIADRKPTDVVYEVPLNMVMFYRYQGMNDAITKESIGKLSMTGSGEESFSFVPNAKVIEQLKPLQKESLLKEASNAQAIRSTEDAVTINESILTYPEPAKTPTPAARKAEPKIVEEGEKEFTDKSDAQSKRFETIEEAKQIEVTAAQQSTQRKEMAKTQSAVETQKYLEDSKRLREEYALRDKEREQALVAARIEKQATLPVLPNRAVSEVNPASASPKLISHAVSEGIFLFEETFLVEQGSLRHEYKKSIYHWLFFDAIYYTRDQDEISQNEYDSLKKQLDI